MTIRFASGASHFGFLLVDLAYFIQAVTIRSFSNQNRKFAKLMSARRDFFTPCHLSHQLIVPIKDSLLGESSDAGNLD